jgi:hypothetical protein
MAIDVQSGKVAATGTWGAFRGEMRRWLGRRGLFHLMFWLLLIDGWLYFTVVTKHVPFGGLGYESLMHMLVFFPIIAAIILTDATVVGEYHSGIAAWTLSKPVPRSGYVVAKLGALWVGLSVTAIFIPGLVANWWLPGVEPYQFVTPEAPPTGLLLGGLFVVTLVMLLFITLTGLLSTVIRRRGIAALIALLGYFFVRVPLREAWDGWDRYTPTGLIGTDRGWAAVTEYVHGESLNATSALVIVVVLSMLFTIGSALVYRRLEL